MGVKANFASAKAAPTAVAEPENAAAAAADTAAIDQAGVRRALEGVYANDMGKKGPDRETFMTPDLKNAMAYASKVDEDFFDNVDPVCGCQDTQNATLTIKTVTVSGDQAQVTADFNPWPGPGGTGSRKRSYDLIRTSKGWLLDDFDGSKAEMKAAKPSPSSEEP